MLIALAEQHPVAASVVAATRPLILAALATDETEVTHHLEVEEKAERELDRAY